MSITAPPSNNGLKPTASRQDRGFFDVWNLPKMLYHWGAKRRLNPGRSAFGERDRHSFFDVMSQIALPELPLCQLRRAGARCAEVVRAPVVRHARWGKAD